MLTGHLQMLDTISKAPPDQNGETSNMKWIIIYIHNIVWMKTF